MIKKTTCGHFNEEHSRPKFNWKDSVSWKSFSRSILVESEEASAHNDYIIAEITKVIHSLPQKRVENDQKEYFSVITFRSICDEKTTTL